MPDVLILFEKLRTLLEWHARGSADLDLRPLIDEFASAWPFTDAAIEISPVAAGVYRLYRNGRLIYIGLALRGAGIRAELESHRRGAHGSCTQGASAFLFELTDDPPAVYRRYLEIHRERYGGRLPPCQNGGA